MVKPVVLTPVSEEDLEQITDYLFENWGMAVTNRFISRFEEICAMISMHPKMFPVINEKKNIRKCVLSQQNVIYYRERQHQLEIISIFDTRRSPDKIYDIIKKV